MPKNSGNILIPLLAGALILTLAIAFLFWQIQQTEQIKTVTSPTPVARQAKESDAWKEISFPKNNFNLKIPKGWVVIVDPPNGPTINSMGGQSVIGASVKNINIHEEGDSVNSLDFDFTKGLPNGIVTHGASSMFEKILATFEFTNQGTTKFDGCGKPTSYAQKSWFADFNQSLTSQDLLIDQIADMCVALDSSKLIFLLKAEHCQAPAIYMFQTSSRSLSKAKFNSQGRTCLAAPTEFSLRNDYIIPLRGEMEEAGCDFDMDYLYNLEDNTLKLREVRSYCQNKPGETTRY